MKKKVVLVFLFWFALGSVSFGAPKSLICTQTTKVEGRGTVVSSKTWMKGNKFRTEVIMEGRKAILIGKEGAVYQYIPDQNIAMKMPFGMGQEGLNVDLESIDEYYSKWDLIGTEIVDGKPCDVRSFTDTQIGVSTKAWVWKKHSFPIKMVSHGPGGKTETIIKDIQINPHIPDSMFELPSGVKIMDMKQMMQQSPSGMRY